MPKRFDRCLVFKEKALYSLGIFVGLFLVGIAENEAHAIDISTTDAYGITTAIKKANPNLDWVWLVKPHPISPEYSVVHVTAQETKIGWTSILHGFFLVSTSSQTIVKPIIVLHSDAESLNLVNASNDSITLVERSMHGEELSRNTYFFDTDPTSPISKHATQPVNISVIEPFGENIFFAGTIDRTGLIIKTGFRNGRIDPRNGEITTRIKGGKISPIVLAKSEGGILRMYASTAIYVSNGNNWATINKTSSKYFRAQDPCADIPFEKLIKLSSTAYMVGYDQCERQRYRNGDAESVGYAGRCESDLPGRDSHLPTGYDGIYERWELPSHIVTISTSPLHRFFVWNANRNPHGVYEIGSDKCRFYQMPYPDHATLLRYNAGNEGCEINGEMASFQELDGRIWFCTNAYGGEGACGMGALGYYDMKEKKFEIYYSSLTSIGCSTLMAEKGKIWIGLQGSPISKGLAAFDTSSKNIAVYDVPEVINTIRKVGDSMIMGTENGIFELSGGGKVYSLGPRINKDGEYQLNLSE